MLAQGRNKVETKMSLKKKSLRNVALDHSGLNLKKTPPIAQTSVLPWIGEVRLITQEQNHS